MSKDKFKEFTRNDLVGIIEEKRNADVKPLTIEKSNRKG
jgi:hypothetical protein